MKKSEIRKDYLLDKYVIIAPGRGKRRRDLTEQSVVIPQPSPFTPDHLKGVKIIDSIGAKKNRVIAIKNIFPAVSERTPKAYGVQEVIIETPDPALTLEETGPAQIKRVLEMYARRTRALARKRRLNYILCFKNEGSKAGASLKHAHSQVFATELLPPDIAKAAAKTAEYYEKAGRSFYSGLIEQEMKSPRRIYENDYIAVFAPYASFYHYEAWILTKRPIDNISHLNNRELPALANALYGVLSALKKLGLSYNFFCHQAIADRTEHFCLKVEPRDSVWAGIELGSGLVINSVSPEEAARFYRPYVGRKK